MSKQVTVEVYFLRKLGEYDTIGLAPSAPVPPWQTQTIPVWAKKKIKKKIKKRKRGVCGVCYKTFVLRKDGRIRVHNGYTNGIRCSGSDDLPLP